MLEVVSREIMIVTKETFLRHVLFSLMSWALSSSLSTLFIISATLMNYVIIDA